VHPGVARDLYLWRVTLQRVRGRSAHCSAT
jgi:hypothetical protein